MAMLTTQGDFDTILMWIKPRVQRWPILVSGSLRDFARMIVAGSDVRILGWPNKASSKNRRRFQPRGRSSPGRSRAGHNS